VAIIDWYSRYVLSWRLSNTLDTTFCVDALEEALERWGTPEIFNTDQGAQFTATAFTDVLKNHGVKISMDGKGREIRSTKRLRLVQDRRPRAVMRQPEFLHSTQARIRAFWHAASDVGRAEPGQKCTFPLST
jgi:transposase InsO family protein